MATALAQQLSKLSAPQTDILDHSKKKVSILFPVAEAKKYSKETFYQIGLSGFRELLEVDNEFEKYAESLFGKKTIGLQRAVESTEFNKKLDSSIESFLLLLSAYLEKQAALKALEWLFHRFYVGSMNVNSVLMCIMPYYETTVFARILQVLSLKKSKQWAWLFRAQRSGVGLTKNIVYSQWATDSSFRIFVTQFMSKMIKTCKVKRNLRTAISFFITTQMGGANIAERVHEDHVSAISLSLEDCLESGNNDLIAGIYFMIMHLSLKTKFSKAFLDSLLTCLCKAPPSELTEQFCLCLLTVCNHQNVAHLPADVVTGLSSQHSVLDYISSIAKDKSVAPFIAPYVEERVRLLFRDRSPLNSKEIKQRKNNFLDLLNYILEMPLTPVEASKVIRSFILGMHENIKRIKKHANLTIEEIVQKLDASHPEGCDQAAVRFFLSAYGKKSDTESWSSLPFDKKKLSSFLSISDPDTLSEILSTILDNDQNVMNTIGKQNIHNECSKITERAHMDLSDSNWWIVYEKVIRIISERTVSKLAGEKERLRVALRILYILFLTNFTEQKLKQFLKSKLARRVPLLVALEEIICGKVTQPRAEVLKDIWDMLPRAFAKLDVSETVKVFEVIKEQTTSERNPSTFVFFLCILHSQITLTGKSDTQKSIVNFLLNSCKHLLKDNSLKFQTTESEYGTKVDYVQCVRNAANNSISANAVFNFLHSISNYIHIQISTNPAAYKSYWALEENTEKKFGDDVKMLLVAVECILLMQQRGQDQCAKVLVSHLFGKVLDEEGKWRFLSIIWSWHPEVSSESINVNLKLWSLNLAKALIKNSSLEKYSILSNDEPVLPSLLMLLCHNNDELSSAVFDFLSLLKSRCKNVSTCFSNIVQVLLKCQTEMLSDFSYLPIAVASVDVQLKENIIETFLSLIKSDLVFSHIKCLLLYVLSHFTDVRILSELIPYCSSLLNKVVVLEENGLLDPINSLSLYYILLRFASADASFLTIEGGWELFRRCVGISRAVLQVNDEAFSPLDLVINYSVLKRLDFKSEKQLELLNLLLTKAVVSKTSKEASKLRKELRKITIDCSRFVALLDRLQLIPKVKSVRESRAKKIKKQPSISSDSESETVVNWRKLGLLVELVGIIDDLRQPWLLIGPLCAHLHHTFMLDAALVDVLQQQILSLLHHLLETSTKLLGDEFAQKVELDIVVVVQCIRTSHNPDIHRRALLILAIGAKHFPTQVLHSIMAIFTFMGSSLVRRDDVYSFQVIHMTIDSIIPVLVESEKSDQPSLLKQLAQITQVFVDVLPDIASHRRLPLFTQLATTMGVSEYLWLLMVLIADSYVMHTLNNDQRSGTLPSNIQFSLSLYSQFTLEEQLVATVEVFKFCAALPDEKKMLKHSLKNAAYLSAVPLDNHSSKQLKHLKFVCLGLLVRLVTSEQFIGKVHEAASKDGRETEDEKLQTIYQNLLEKGLEQLKYVTENEAVYAEHGDSHFGFAMKKKLVDFVDAINNLLPPTILIGVISNLFKSDVALMRLRAMEILSQKLQPGSDFFGESDTPHLIKLFSKLNKVGRDKKEDDANRQTALFALQLMIRKIGSTVDPDIVARTLSEQIILLDQTKLSLQIFTQSILVAGETVVVLKAAILPYLEKFIRKLISVMVDHQNEHLLMAAVTSVQKLVHNVPQFMKSYLSDLIVNTCILIGRQHNISAQKETIKENKLLGKLNSVHQTVAEKIEPRLLVPSLCDSYSTILCSNFFESVEPHFRLTESFINSVKPKELFTYKTKFVSLFTEAMDIRSKEVKKVDLLNLEECIISVLCRFLLKLNEEQNLQVFVNLISWANDESKPHRMTSFFRFCDRLAGILKVLFIRAKLAEKIFAKSADILEKNILLREGDDSLEVEYSEDATELLNYVLDLLCKIFAHDDQFVNEERFKMILTPLINQIENQLGGDVCTATRITEHLKPCIVNFAKAAGDDVLWKDLNRLLMTKLRSDSPKLVIPCLEVFEGIVEAIGEDYLRPLLPDIMPCIMEVLESQEPEVENKTKRIFTKMEDILGDNLRAYLD